MVLNIYYKPTDSFNFLTCNSYHPRHTKINTALSSAKEIINSVTHKIEKRLRELKKHVSERNHPPEIIDCIFIKYFQRKLDKNKDSEKIILSWTFNPNHVIDLSKFIRTLENIRSNELKQCFQNKTV